MIKNWQNIVDLNIVGDHHQSDHWERSRLIEQSNDVTIILIDLLFASDV